MTSLTSRPASCASRRVAGHAGHNGLRSIHQHLGPDYARVRIGIGHPGHKDRVAGYVLSDFAKAEGGMLDDLLRGISDGAPKLAEGDGPGFLNAVGAAGRAAAVLGRIEGPGGGGETLLPRLGGAARGETFRAPASRREVPVRLTEAFAGQARSCAALGSPFMVRLMTLCAEHLTPGPWRGRGAALLLGAAIPPRGTARCRCASRGGLHALRLRGDPGLAAVYPPEAPDDAMLWGRGCRTRSGGGDTFLLDWIRSPPQTNEVGRSAVFRAAGQWLAARWGLPLDLCELGASAGLNLNWDRYALHIGARRFGPEDAVVVLAPDWTGPPPARRTSPSSPRGARAPT